MFVKVKRGQGGSLDVMLKQGPAGGPPGVWGETGLLLVPLAGDDSSPSPTTVTTVPSSPPLSGHPLTTPP